MTIPLPRDARGRFLPRDGFPERDRDPVTGRFVKAQPTVEPTCPKCNGTREIWWMRPGNRPTSSPCPNCAPFDMANAQARASEPQVVHPEWEAMAANMERAKPDAGLNPPCTSCGAVKPLRLRHLCWDCWEAGEAAHRASADYDSHTIAADPFLEPGPAMGLWRRILTSLGWMK